MDLTLHSVFCHRSIFFGVSSSWMKQKIYKNALMRFDIQVFLGSMCFCAQNGTPTKRQVSKRLKRQVYKTSALQNVRFTKHQVVKVSGLQNVRLQKHPYIFLTCGWWKSAGSVAAMFAGIGMAVFYSLF
jgi:hypothetical protein